MFLLRATQQGGPQGKKDLEVKGTWRSGDRGSEGKAETLRSFPVFNTTNRHGIRETKGHVSHRASPLHSFHFRETSDASERLSLDKQCDKVAHSKHHTDTASSVTSA